MDKNNRQLVTIPEKYEDAVLSLFSTEECAHNEKDETATIRAHLALWRFIKVILPGLDLDEHNYIYGVSNLNCGLQVWFEPRKEAI